MGANKISFCANLREQTKMNIVKYQLLLNKFSSINDLENIFVVKCNFGKKD